LFIDTNILVYLSNDQSAFHDRARLALSAAAERGRLAINQIVFAEISTGYPSADALMDWLGRLGVTLEYSPPEALFRASRAFLSYRAAGGPRTSLLPDFFIGADAVAAGEALLTNDPARYRTYYPELELITP